MKVHSEKNTDGVTAKKESYGVSVDLEKKIDEVRVDRGKKSNRVRVHHEKEW